MSQLIVSCAHLGSCVIHALPSFFSCISEIYLQTEQLKQCQGSPGLFYRADLVALVFSLDIFIPVSTPFDLEFTTNLKWMNETTTMHMKDGLSVAHGI